MIIGQRRASRSNTAIINLATEDFTDTDNWRLVSFPAVAPVGAANISAEHTAIFNTQVLATAGGLLAGRRGCGHHRPAVGGGGLRLRPGAGPALA